MRFVLLPSVLFLFFNYSNKNVRLYRAIFRTEITTSTKLIFKDFDVKSKEDSLLLEFSRQFIDNMGEQNILVKMIDSVAVFSDSTIIVSRVLSAQSDFPNSYYKAKGATVVLKKNKLFTKENDGNLKLVETHRNTAFQKTNESETILGYSTVEYINLDSTIKIWCSKKLPNLFNPGVLVDNQKGGILKYEIVEENQKVTSIVDKIIER